MSKPVQIGDCHYAIYKPDVLTAWELHRKVAGIAAQALMAAAVIESDPNNIAAAINIFAPAFSMMPKQDADYVLQTCLSHVARKDQSGSWPSTRVWNGSGLAYDDLSPLTLDYLIFLVLKEALGNFIVEAAAIRQSSGVGQGS